MTLLLWDVFVVSRQVNQGSFDNTPAEFALISDIGDVDDGIDNVTFRP